MSAINELLHDDAIDLNAHAETWQEAIAQAGALLEKTGAITSAYTESMISSVEEQGPYIVVAPGVCVCACSSVRGGETYCDCVDSVRFAGGVPSFE